MYLLLLCVTLASAFSAQKYYNASYHETSVATDLKEVELKEYAPDRDFSTSFTGEMSSSPNAIVKSGYTNYSTVIPPPAICIPEPKVVPLTMDKDLSEKYYPSCTRVNRCGGCCPSDEFISCQPTEIQILHMRVFVRKHVGVSNLNPPRKKIIKVEKHLKCKCDCIVKEKDCNSLQRYIKQQCKCICTNEDEKEKCLLSDPQLKFWDSNSCSCQCRNVQNCTTGYIFNIYSCSCESEQRHTAGQHSSEYSGHK